MVSRRTSTLALTSLAHFTNDGNFLIFPLLINYYQALNAQLIILAIGAILYDVVSGILGTWVGKLADKTGEYGKLIFVGLASQGISIAIFGSAFVYPSLTNVIVLAGATVLGFGQAFYHPLGGTVLSFSFRGTGYGRALGINGSMGSLGRAIVPIIIGFSIPVTGVADSFMILALYEIAVGLVILYGLRKSERKKTPEKTKENIPERTESVARKYRKIIYTLAAVVFIRSIFTTGIVTFTPYYIVQIFGLSHFSPLPNEMASIAFIAPIFGQPLFGIMTIKFGGKTTIALSSVFSILFIIGFMLTHSVYIMTASLAGFAFAIFSGFPVLIGYVSQLVPKDIITASNGLVWGMGSTLGGAIGVVMFYVMYDIVKLNVSYSIWALIIIGAVSVFMIPMLPKRDIKQENELSAG